MSGFQITITQAGIAALVNAQNNGTNAVLVTQIGVTDQAFTPSSTMTALPGESKRLATFSGQAVADDTIHITIRDDTTDAYALRGFGLYLQDGTLFAIYGQAVPIMEKSAQAMLLLSTDIRFVDVVATSITFGDSVWVNPPATTEVMGIVELATPTEAIDGTDPDRAMTPAADKAAMDARLGAGAPTAFVKSLLNAATAALFRTAIGLGDLALKNGGAGGGADADLLDGQHGSYYRAWANLTGVPASFPPSAHGHAWAEISGIPATASRWPTFAEVTDKPGSYPPAAHTHAAADINSGVLADARIPDLAQSKITGLVTSLASKAATGSDSTFSTVRATGNHFYGGLVYTVLSPYGATGMNGVVLLRPDGFGSGAGEVNITVGGITWNGYPLWHSGNFNPATKSDNGHTHTIANVSNLQSTLDAKANLSGANFTGEITAPYLNSSPSDARLKDDIADLKNCLRTVLSIRPRTWRWKSNGESDFGFIAQEHREVLPLAVHQAEPDGEGKEGMLFVRYGKCEALLVGAIHEIADRLSRLEARVYGGAE